MIKKALISGNIYKIIDEKEVRYFQYFYTDPFYLGDNLIWVFNQNKETHNLNEIVDSGYSFCFYTLIESGLKMKKWALVGNVPISEALEFYSSFRWRDLETGIWYKLQYDQKN
ncbi:hypothetical protein D0809_03400 [Flavobacterium circumlabens]|uniref:Uncharacterized protein n=1 Tax=Flavobacterium circumlabens TaxID=2133765 RepID=A0A4Y7UHX3_9FLAO|nr:hypothetical protein [Flavobacterium circumlabens]TCN60934.1 hypothetical protein EV142_101513 [Flavobacterium circumlabens]TEB46053.1 hypothetical protein D0809_03400 [Flavobacterium circumlabens]